MCYTSRGGILSLWILLMRKPGHFSGWWLIRQDTRRRRATSWIRFNCNFDSFGFFEFWLLNNNPYINVWKKVKFIDYIWTLLFLCKWLWIFQNLYPCNVIAYSALTLFSGLIRLANLFRLGAKGNGRNFNLAVVVCTWITLSRSYDMKEKRSDCKHSTNFSEHFPF